MKTSKNKIIANLKKEHAKIQNEKENSIYYKRVYYNLPTTLLERTFFDIISKKKNSDQTKMMRKFVRALMKRYPEVVEEAKEQINKEKS